MIRYFKGDSTNIYVDTLKELYCYQYTPEQDVVIHLVARYRDKLSSNYLENYEKLMFVWKPEARIRSQELFKNLVSAKNTFLEIMGNHESWGGKYYPIPLVYGDEKA